MSTPHRGKLHVWLCILLTNFWNRVCDHTTNSCSCGDVISALRACVGPLWAQPPGHPRKSLQILGSPSRLFMKRCTIVCTTTRYYSESVRKSLQKSGDVVWTSRRMYRRRSCPAHETLPGRQHHRSASGHPAPADGAHCAASNGYRPIRRIRCEASDLGDPAKGRIAHAECAGFS